MFIRLVETALSSDTCNKYDGACSGCTQQLTMLKSAYCNNRQWYEFCQTLVVYFRVMFVVRQHPIPSLCSTDNLLVYVSYRTECIMWRSTMRAACLAPLILLIVITVLLCSEWYTLWRYALCNVTHPVVTFLLLLFPPQNIFLRTSQQTHVSFFFPQGDIAMLAPCDPTGDIVLLDTVRVCLGRRQEYKPGASIPSSNFICCSFWFIAVVSRFCASFSHLYLNWLLL